MKKLWILLIAIMLCTSFAPIASAAGPDTPLNEHVYEIKGPVFVQVVGAGVNGTVPQTAWPYLPDWLVSSTVEQAYLYVTLIYSGASDDPAVNATVTLNAVGLGTVGPYASDFVNAVFGDFWNIYRFDVTSLVSAAGGGIYTVTVDADDATAHVSNVVLVVFYSDPAASYKHLILNDGIEALWSAGSSGVNQTTYFHNVGPSFTGMELDVVVAEGSPPSVYPYLEEVWVETSMHGWGHAGNLWNSTQGPSFDDHWMLLSFAPPLLTSDVNVTVGTGDDEIGWQLVVLQAFLRDVSADSQTHPNAQVVQGATEAVDVVVSNNGEASYGMDETFDVALSVSGPVSGIVNTTTVTNLAPGSSTTVTLYWNTTGWPTGTYGIWAHADAGLTIPEYDESNNDCEDLTTLRIMAGPTADADGPYTGPEGTAITFDATGSTDPDGTIVLYEWDWDNDGTYDTSTTSPTTPHTWGDDAASLTVGLRITDDDGLTDTATATVTVTNVPPTIVTVTLTDLQYAGCHDAVADFAAAFTDPGWLDTHTAVWDWGDGTSPEPGAVTEENLEPDATGTVTGSHTFKAALDYTITLTVVDDEGGTDTYVFELEGGAVGGKIIPTNALISLAPWLALAGAAVVIAVGIPLRKRR